MENLEFEIPLPEGFYQVYEIDICWQGWAIHWAQVGAKNIDDLKKHLNETLKGIVTRRQLNELKNEKSEDRFSRIRPIENVYTTTPYKILTDYAYSE